MTSKTSKTAKEILIGKCFVIIGADSKIQYRGVVRALKAGPTGDLHFIYGESGRPLTNESFDNLFRDACNATGVKKSAHGLRKLAAT